MTYGIVHLVVHEHAREDLDELWRTDPNAAAFIVVVLEQLEADPRALELLTTRGNNNLGSCTISIKRWQSLRRKGIEDFWRFRILNSPATNYRIVYCYNYQTRHLCALGIVHKDGFDYDDHDSSIAQRIIADWRAL